jgi:hypothetical protein
VLETRHLVWPLLVASLIVGAAALVRIADPSGGAGDDITGVIRVPWPATATIASLLTLAALVFFVGIFRRLRSRRHGDEEWLRPAPVPRPQSRSDGRRGCKGWPRSSRS